MTLSLELGVLPLEIHLFNRGRMLGCFLTHRSISRLLNRHWPTTFQPGILLAFTQL